MSQGHGFFHGRPRRRDAHSPFDVVAGMAEMRSEAITLPEDRPGPLLGAIARSGMPDHSAERGADRD
jgi:hypothetical protein